MVVNTSASIPLAAMDATVVMDTTWSLMGKTAAVCVLMSCFITIVLHFSSDVDECAVGKHDCDANAECINEEGGYSCECGDGFFGNGTNGTCFGNFRYYNFCQFTCHN